MKINKSLVNEYDQNILEDDQVQIIKLACILSISFCFILLLLTILSLISYPIVIGYAIGSIVSILFFYHIIRVVKESNPLDYMKVTRKMRWLHQGAYVLVLIGIYLIFENVFAVLSMTAGLLLIRFSIFIYYLRHKGSK